MVLVVKGTRRDDVFVKSGKRMYWKHTRTDSLTVRYTANKPPLKPNQGDGSHLQEGVVDLREQGGVYIHWTLRNKWHSDVQLCRWLHCLFSHEMSRTPNLMRSSSLKWPLNTDEKLKGQFIFHFQCSSTIAERQTQKHEFVLQRNLTEKTSKCSYHTCRLDESTGTSLIAVFSNYYKTWPTNTNTKMH